MNLSELIEAANEIDVFNAPINVPSHINDEGDDTPPKQVGKDVVEKSERSEP